MRELQLVQPTGEAGLAAAIEQLAHHAARRASLVVLSDLHEPRPTVAAALSAFVARGGEAAVFHILHPDELRLPQVNTKATVEYVDSETGRRVRFDGTEEDEYQGRVQTYLHTWRDELTRRGVSYTLAYSDAALTATLRHHLLARSRSVGSRG